MKKLEVIWTKMVWIHDEPTHWEVWRYRSPGVIGNSTHTITFTDTADAEAQLAVIYPQDTS
jgi:hypothetical protein